MQKGIEQTSKQSTGCRGRQDAEQRSASGDPPERLLQDLCAQSTLDQVTDCKSSEGAILVEVGADHCPRGSDASTGECLLKPRRRQVDDYHRAAGERQRRPHALERFRIVRDGEVASLSA
ncbi:MAG TPA: hypothetical protein VIY71_10545 [Solirubrobacterales bacterium]